MKPLFLFLALPLLWLFPALSAAQTMPDDCRLILAPDGINTEVAPDIILQPMVPAGTFGGQISCQYTTTANGTEGMFLEQFASDGTISKFVKYTDGAITLMFKFNEDPDYIEAAGCNVAAEGDYTCWSDLGLGEAVLVFYRYNAGFQLTNVQMVVQPGKGILNQKTWREIATLDPGSPDFDITLDLVIQGTETGLSMSVLPDNNGSYDFYADQQPAYDFVERLRAATGADLIVKISTTLPWITDQGKGSVTTNYERAFPADYASFALGAMFQFKDTIAANLQ